MKKYFINRSYNLKKNRIRSYTWLYTGNNKSV